jgi:hypothetical protein
MQLVALTSGSPRRNQGPHDFGRLVDADILFGQLRFDLNVPDKRAERHALFCCHKS